jgi:hypothetical protein
MPSSYSTRLRLEDIGNGEQTGTWGDTTDRNITQLVEEAIAGVASVSMTDANYTLTALNATSDEARQFVLDITGTLTATRNVVCPTAEKVWIVYNHTTGGQSIVFKTSAGTGITIANGNKQMVYCDGTNVVDALTVLTSGSTFATLTGIETLTNKTLTSPTINTPTITVNDNAFTLQDNGDTSKKAVFELSGITTATTRTLTVPNASDTLMALALAQSPTNKTFDVTNIWTVRDDRWTMQDSGDVTRQMAFQLSGITSGQTRTLTVPDTSGTLLLTTGSGAALTGIRIQGKETIWYLASGMTIPASGGAASGSTDGTNISYKTLDFANNEVAYFQIAMPKSWNKGTITFIPYWTAASGSGTVTWSLSAVAISNDDPLDTATGTAQTSADTLIAAGDNHVGPESSAITVSGSPANDDLVAFKISRSAGTLAVDAKLIGMRIIYTTNASDDT